MLRRELAVFGFLLLAHLIVLSAQARDPFGPADSPSRSLLRGTGLRLFGPVLSLSSNVGGFFGGDRFSANSAVRWRMGERFSSSLGWNHNDIDLPVANGDFEVNVARLRLSYSFTPKILLQALVQYDDRSDLIGTNIRFSWLQSANAGLYLVYNEVDDDTVGGPIEKRREFVLKYSRIIDLL